MSEFQMLPAAYPVFAVSETKNGSLRRRIVIGWFDNDCVLYPESCEGEFIGFEIPNVGFLDDFQRLTDWATWQEQAKAKAATKA